MWQALVKFIEDNGKNPLVVAIVAALLGALLTRLLPWLFHQLSTLGSAALALSGGRWQDYRFERRYLDWLIGRHRFLGQLPSNVAVATGEQAQLAELEQIYVALSVTPGGMGASDDIEPSVPREIDLMRRRPSGWMRLIPERFRPQEPPQSDVGRAIEQHLRLVIRGDPGSGKTTLLKYLAVTCARAVRNDRREGDDRKLAFKRLGWKERPFPIFISLGRHGQVTAWEKGRTLLDACADEWKAA